MPKQMPTTKTTRRRSRRQKRPTPAPQRRHQRVPSATNKTPTMTRSSLPSPPREPNLRSTEYRILECKLEISRLKEARALANLERLEKEDEFPQTDAEESDAYATPRKEFADGKDEEEPERGDSDDATEYRRCTCSRTRRGGRYY